MKKSMCMAVCDDYTDDILSDTHERTSNSERAHQNGQEILYACCCMYLC